MQEESKYIVSVKKELTPEKGGYYGTEEFYRLTEDFNLRVFHINDDPTNKIHGYFVYIEYKGTPDKRGQSILECEKLLTQEEVNKRIESLLSLPQEELNKYLNTFIARSNPGYLNG